MKERKESMENVDIKDKLCLTISEMTQLTGIGRDKLTELAKRPDADFTLFVGRKCLIKRAQFERFLERTNTL